MGEGMGKVSPILAQHTAVRRRAQQTRGNKAGINVGDGERKIISQNPCLYTSRSESLMA